MSVPQDDTHSRFYNIFWSSEERLVDEPARQQRLDIFGLHPEQLDEYGMTPQHPLVGDLGRRNRFAQNRSAMSAGSSFTGLNGLTAEDTAMTSSMGDLYDRQREHLVPADLAVIRLRRILRSIAAEDPDATRTATHRSNSSPPSKPSSAWTTTGTNSCHSTGSRRSDCRLRPRDLSRSLSLPATSTRTIPTPRRTMLNDIKILDVHSHVSHPMHGMGRMLMFMLATNMNMDSPIGTAAAEEAGLGAEEFAVAVERHVAYIDERNIDAQVLGPRPFLMLGWMEPHLLPAWTRLVNDTIHYQCQLQPNRFVGACQLPQDATAADSSHMISELRRTVEDLDFVGVYVSPDPDGRRTSPGMADRYWYPLYEECSEREPADHHPRQQHPRPPLQPRTPQLPTRLRRRSNTGPGKCLSHSDVFEHFPELGS